MYDILLFVDFRQSYRFQNSWDAAGIWSVDMEYLLSGIVIASALVQGGFYPTVFLLCGAFLAVLCVAGHRAVHPHAAEFALWVLALVYLLASLFHGYSSASLAQACFPLCCACFLGCYRMLSGTQRARFFQILLWASGVIAGLGMLAFCGVLALPEAVTAHRLQFPFQYANAAGSWFAALALLSQEEKSFHIPLITALLLTRSMGALSLYALCQLLWLWRRHGDQQECLLSHALAVLFAVALFFASGVFAAGLVALLYIAGWKFDAISMFTQRIRLPWVGLLLGGGGLLSLVLLRRTVSPLATLAERLVQIWDGMKLIAAHPLLGVGAGNWDAWYPHIQSAQYVSRVVHSAPVQAGVDAGIPALLALAVFLTLAWRCGHRTSPQNLAAGLLCIHSLLDFTMQFFPIACFLLALLFVGEEEAKPPAPVSTFLRRILPLAGGFLCAGMFWGELQNRQLIYAWQRQDLEGLTARYEAQISLLGKNRTARALYVRAQSLLGQPEALLDTTSKADDLTTEEVLVHAQALRLLGDEDAACTWLVGQLERQPFCVALYEGTARLLEEWNAERWFDGYNQLAEQANARRSLLAGWMGNQVDINPIGNHGKEN